MKNAKAKTGVTLDEIGEMLVFVVEHMVTKEELDEKLDRSLGSLRTELKSDLFKLHTQVNSIESELREMKHSRLELRVADLEEKVFGKTR